MKNIIILVLLGIFILSKPQAEYTLKDAIAKNIISCTVNGNSNSTHYSKPLIINIKNKKNTNIKIKINNGLQFIPVDSNYQNIVITRHELLVLNGYENKEVVLYGMCTENYDRAPSKNVEYKTSIIADEGLSKLSKFIEKKKYYNTIAQNAVWAVSCNKSLENIAGFDTIAAKELIEIAAQITEKPIPPPPDPNDYHRNYYVPPRTYRIRIGGEYNYSFPKQTAIQIAMFDTNEILVRELFNNPAVAPGEHKFEYKFDASVYTDSLYLIRFIADNEIQLEGEYKRPF